MRKDKIYAEINTMTTMYATLMCPHCYKMNKAIYTVDYTFNKNHKLHSEIHLNNRSRELYKNGLMKAGACRLCSSSDPIILDSRIAKTIQVLNMKGYRTKFCCHGHLYLDGVAQPYIAFEDWVPIAMFQGLPSGWELDINGDSNTVYGKHFGIMPSIYYRPMELPYNINFDQTKLYRWAKDLPDIIDIAAEHCENANKWSKGEPL
jgi:hypothetical protein